MLLPTHLTELLICPLCRGELSSIENEAQLRCRSCGHSYAVRDFPIMLPVMEPESADSSVSATKFAGQNPMLDDS